MTTITKEQDNVTAAVRLEWITPEPEKALVRMARVSNPANQDNENIEGLLRHCYRNNHWSVFEMVTMCLEIKTSRAIGRQLLRHWSFRWQEFSQRYAKVIAWEAIHPRAQATKNRQASTDTLDDDTKTWFYQQTERIQDMVTELYSEALDRGIAKESARFWLPEMASTTMYATANVRSWIHWINLRCDPEQEAQLEHVEIARAARTILVSHCPTIGGLMPH